MSGATPSLVPGWFRPVVVLAILWNAFGVVMYLSSVGVFGDPQAGLTDAQRAAAAAIPKWIMAMFAIGTFAGLAGSVGLFLGKAWSRAVLILSMVALLIMEGWIVFLSGAVEHYGLAVPVMVSFGAVLLTWLSTKALRSGWLN